MNKVKEEKAFLRPETILRDSMQPGTRKRPDF
jgi:hypothetical protein